MLKKIFKYVFSITEQGTHKIYYCCGLKIKIKSIELVKCKELKDQLENIEYEFAKKFNLHNTTYAIPNVESIERTIDEIIEKKMSIARFGDGEFYTIVNPNNNQGYYKESNLKVLASRLIEVLTSNIPNLKVCIWDYFGDLSKYTEESKSIARMHMKNLRATIDKYLNENYEYGNAFVTRPYINLCNKAKSPLYFSKLKEIWKDKDLLIIEGKSSMLGVNNDLFANAKSLQRIVCPSENAYRKYDDILNYVKTINPTNKLILIALGMTATVLAYDLSKLGYWALDIGHVDIEYEWYLRKANKPTNIQHKAVGDINKYSAKSYKNKEYISQIIKEIK